MFLHIKDIENTNNSLTYIFSKMQNSTFAVILWPSKLSIL